MDEMKILAKLQAIQMKALTAAAYVLLAHVLPFVPIAGNENDVNSLRGSREIKAVDGGIGISFGGRGDSTEYAAYQYYEAENHLFRSGAMGRLVELLHGEERADVAGEISKDRYATAYRQAMDEGRLTRFPNGARWFEIVMKDKEVLHRAWMAYSNAMRAA